MGNIENLVYRTDCIFHECNGVIEEKEDYFVIRTPANPDFWFGNFILFRAAPEKDDFGDWLRIHDLEFGESLKHVVFGWDSEVQGSTREFEDHGFRLVREVGLRMGEYKPSSKINRLVTPME